MINEIKRSQDKKLNCNPLIRELDEYLVRCGISEPYEKVYVKNAPEFNNVDMGQMLAIIMVAQLSKLRLCISTGKLRSEMNPINEKLC